MDNQQPTPSKPSRTKFGRLLVFALVVFGVGATATLALYIASFALGIHGSVSQCNKGRDQLFARTQRITDGFNAIEFAPGQKSTDLKVMKQQGDCLDSLPTIALYKSYNVSKPAGVVFDDMNSALTKDGYKPKSDSFTNLNPCSYDGRRYDYTKGDQTIDIGVACSRGVANGSEWRQVPATKVSAQLIAAWAYPKE